MAVTLNESSWTLITEVQESPSELGGKVFNRVYGKIKTRYGAAHNVTLISFEWHVGILYNSSGGVYNSYTRAHSFTMTNPVVNEPYSGNWAFGGRYYTSGAETVKASWEKAVYHDDNGQYSHTMTMTFGGWNNENRTATQTVNLPAYSRYSTLSVGNYNLGSAVTATVTQQASGFSSIVYYRYPGLSSTWAELGRATGSTSLSISGTPSNVVSQITNSTTVTAEFKVRTYFANNYSGDYLETSPTKTVTASVPASYKPSLTLAAVTEGNSAISSAFGSGTFVNGYSKLNAKGTFGASAGSTPISYTFTYFGIDNNITSTATTYTFQFTPVSGAGKVYGKVTDSRGRVSSQVNKTFTAYDYTPPTIQIRATRGTYSGDTFTADIFGTAVRVEAKWTCASVNSKNAAQSIVVNDGTADRATYTPSTLSASDWVVIANIKNVTYATTSQYTFTAKISDKLKSATATATIGTSSMPLSLYHQSGNVGAAIGQMASSAEAGKFNVYLPTNLKSTLNVTGNVAFSGATSGVITTEVARPAAARQSGTLTPIEQLFITDLSTNKIFGIPAANITAEYSTNGGSSWTSYGNDTARKSLFMDLQDNNFYLGGHSAKGTATTSDMLRITINVTDRYAEVSSAYFWITTNGATPFVTLQKSTVGATTTFTDIFTDMPLAGWSGPNIKYFTATRMGGSGTSNVHSFRFIFKQTAVSANYGSASVSSIRMFGVPTWTAPNNMMKNGHLYAWDTNFGAYFPQIVTAQGFSAEELDIVANTFTDANSVWPTKITHGSMTMGKLGSSSANLPKAATFTILAYRYDATDGWQMAIPVQASPAVYMRMYRAGVWQSWRLIGGDRTNTANVITRTAGATCDYSQMVQEGSVRTLYAKFTYSTSVASGSNIFTGTMGMDFRPNYDVEGFAYYSNRAIGIRISPTSTGANVTVRNASASAVTISDSIYFSLTYVI